MVGENPSVSVKPDSAIGCRECRQRVNKIMLLGTAGKSYFVTWLLPRSVLTSFFSFALSSSPFWIERTLYYSDQAPFVTGLWQVHPLSISPPSPQTLMDSHMHSLHRKLFSTWPSISVPYSSLLLPCLLLSTVPILFSLVIPISTCCSLPGKLLWSI